MTYTQLVAAFQEVTGRYDLSEARIKALLQDGQVLIDGRISISNMGRIPYSITADTYTVQLVNMSRVEQVLWKNSDGKYIADLTQKTWKNLLNCIQRFLKLVQVNQRIMHCFLICTMLPHEVMRCILVHLQIKLEH